MLFQILVCDDDPEIRAAMRRTLCRHEVTTVASPAEGLAALKARRYHAVISDFELGAESDGLEFLQVVRLMYPDTVRFLVTGSRDLQVVIRAVNEGSVHRYFLKPWDDETLAGAIAVQLHAHGGGSERPALAPT